MRPSLREKKRANFEKKRSKRSEKPRSFGSVNFKRNSFAFAPKLKGNAPLKLLNCRRLIFSLEGSRRYISMRSPFSPLSSDLIPSVLQGAAPGMSVGVGAAPVFKSSLFMPISPGIAPSSPDSSAAMFANLPNQSILNLVDVDSPKPAHASPVTIPSSLSGLQFGAADPPKPTAQDVKMPTPSAPPAASSPSPAGSNSSAPRPAASAAELLYRSPPNNHLNHSPATEESPKVVRAVVTTTHHAPLLPPSVVVHKEQPRISPSNSNDKLGSGSGSPIVPPPNSSSPTTSSKTDAAPLIPLPSSKR